MNQIPQDKSKPVNAEEENPYAPPQAEASAIDRQANFDSRPSWTRWKMAAWLCIAASIVYICRNSIGVAESTIREDLGLTKTQMGAAMSFFFFSYALAQIPTAWLGNWLGSRRAIPLFAILWSIATAAMSFSFGLTMLITTRLSNGLAQAGIFPACTNTISKWFPDTQRATASGSLSAFMSVGGAIGVGLTGVLMIYIGWRGTFIAYSLLGLLWSFGFYRWFRNLPEEHAGVNAAELNLIRAGREEMIAEEGKNESSVWTHMLVGLALVSSPATWWICGQQFCRAAGQIFFTSWFASYLQETREVSIADSGLLSMIPLLALVVGCFVGGATSDWILAKTGSRRLARQGVAAVCMFLCAMLVFVAYFIQNPIGAVLTISLGAFCAAVGGPCAYTITMDMGGRHVSSLFALMNMIGNLGAFAFISGVGLYLDATENWEAVLLWFGFMYLGAFLFWLLLNPNGTVFDQSFISIKTKEES